MRTEININSSMFAWAIARAGYELNDFVIKFPKVLEWMENEKKPTVKQLETFSHKVHVPFGYLFLQNPPQEKLPIPFFRTGRTQATKVSLNVFDTILLLQRRQEWLVDYLKDNEFGNLEYVGKFQRSNNYQEIVHDIRKTLELENEWASSFETFDAALKHLTEKIEEAGIIVTFNGVVENYNKRPIPVDECRGFVLVNSIAPFMFINAADGKGAQAFSMIHELAHIWTGYSAGFDFRRLLPADNPVEILCDKVAAEFLVPAVSFKDAWNKRADIKYLARHFKVSPIVIARRALDLGAITKTVFFNFYNHYINELKNKKEKKKDGGDFYATQKKRLSVRFTHFINQAVKEKKLLYRDAYKLTGLKGDTYETLTSKHLY